VSSALTVTLITKKMLCSVQIAGKRLAEFYGLNLAFF
jgi:hypothetical protein